VKKKKKKVMKLKKKVTKPLMNLKNPLKKQLQPTLSVSLKLIVERRTILKYR
jgi:hypothetical protein